MADAALKRRVRNVLRREFSAEGDVVHVSDGDDVDDVHVLVISHRFDGRGLNDRTDLICSGLMRRLSPDEWGLVSVAKGFSPERANGASIRYLKII